MTTTAKPDPLSALPPNKPIIFTNLLRFHEQTQYPETVPDSVARYLIESESESSSGTNSSLSAATANSVPSLSPPASIPGSQAYWTRYFPIYHATAREILESDADTLQRVIYKGAPLVSLRGARGVKLVGEGGNGAGSNVEVSGNANATTQTDSDPNQTPYWHALVVTWVSSWDVVTRISENERYKVLGGFHRDAAVEDDELYVSCAVEGFEAAWMG